MCTIMPKQQVQWTGTHSSSISLEGIEHANGLVTKMYDSGYIEHSGTNVV